MKSLIYISCLFSGTDKPYTYITNDDTIKVGDFVIVESNKSTDRKIPAHFNVGLRSLNILSILEVVQVGVKPVESIKYKPIVQKVDFKNYFEMLGI